ncbi:MAG: [FeFe] hydrogenase H-cluster radical SAM maturase HydE [Candidatus Hydrogenedentes bacterium]|nr:[FeFe] hydrogenase H-cluster radical SAM maturase HydE [Candidatus Hydrogenedentota bacterium]
MQDHEILAWLREEDGARVRELWQAADAVRAEVVGPQVHLRGLIEISNYCCRECAYCGLRAPARDVARYRMTADEILAAARQAVSFGYGTVVMQAGEDYGITREALAGTIRRIKAETPLAVTLSMGERPEEDLAAWREAGADRYLLRFETSDAELYRRIHPTPPGRAHRDRIAVLPVLRKLGYEVGSGVMIGTPGQTVASLARDIALFRALDLDMIGEGPFIAHPDTPLGGGAPRTAPEGEQVPDSARMTCSVLALTRLVCPEANIPSTTALATVDPIAGHEQGLRCGANVVMPNLTPGRYRALYSIYPDKEGIHDDPQVFHERLLARLHALGREPGAGPGNRIRRTAAG